MVLTEDRRNRRLPPKRRLQNKLLLTIIGFTIIGLIFLIGCAGFYLVFLNSDKFSTLTGEQISILNQLKDELSWNFTHDYMKSNEFLIPFLKDKNWNLEDTSKMLSNHLTWRQDNLENNKEDNFEDFKNDFPYYTDGVDREGRLVITIDFGRWKVRSTITSGEGHTFLKSIYRLFEQYLNLHEFNQNRTENASEILIVANLQGFSMLSSGCFHCIQYYLTAFSALQENYPDYKEILHKLILINTPEDFDFILALAPDGIENLLEVHGTNKSKWKKVVLRLISPDQIRSQFGGTKSSDTF